MAKLNRFNYKLFARDASSSQLAVIGSLRAGTPTFSTDYEALQALPNYTDGWFGIAMGENSPAIEDMNALQHVESGAIYYLYQMGIPEWHTLTEYPLNAIVNSAGTLYKSLQNLNVGHALSETAWWAVWSQPLNVVNFGPGTGDYSILPGQSYVRVNAVGGSGGVVLAILPVLANVPLGYKVTVKNVSASSAPGTYLVNLSTGNSGTETIEGVLGPVQLESFPAKEAITLVKVSATNWDVI